jgi:hypothetical protein
MALPAQILIDLQASEILCKRPMSSGDVASIRSDMPGLLPRVPSKICHRFDEVVVLLPRKARRGAVALKVIKVAAGAADGRVRFYCRGGHVCRRRLLLQIGPLQLGKIFSERKQVLMLERCRNR